MEHSDLDKLFRNAVDSVESKAELSEGNNERLWNSIDKGSVANGQWFWKVASIVLFMLSSALAIALLTNKPSVKTMAQEVKRETPKEVSPTIKVDTIYKAVQVPAPEDKTEVLKETVIEYVDREKLVYIEKEVIIDRQEEVDSLLFALQENQQEIQLLSRRLKSANEQEPSNNNLQVAFLSDNSIESSAKNPDSKLKFQLSLFNSHKQ